MGQESKEIKLQGRYPEYTVRRERGREGREGREQGDGGRGNKGRERRREVESNGRERGSKDATQARSVSGGREG